MNWVVLFFLGLSAFLYCLLGGADFGIGVHELFIKPENKRKHEDIVKEAIGPVWEANHMWLIIVVVVLFVGFPKLYTEISIHLHIPIMLMLMGIIMRGCAFTFRHYDSIEDGSRKYYSLVFSISSILTPIMLGVIVGSLMLGRIQTQPTTYFETYVAPWANLYSFSVGFFVLSVFAFIASIFMVGETTIGQFKDNYIKRGKVSHSIMIIVGAFVFLSAEIDGVHLISQFMAHPVALTAFLLASISHIFLWKLFKVKQAWGLRFLTGFQLLMILTAWMAVNYPNIIAYADGTFLSLVIPMAPPKTLFALGMALIIGAAFFLPVLGYLFFIFKRPLKGEGY